MENMISTMVKMSLEQNKVFMELNSELKLIKELHSELQKINNNNNKKNEEKNKEVVPYSSCGFPFPLTTRPHHVRYVPKCIRVSQWHKGFSIPYTGLHHSPFLGKQNHHDDRICTYIPDASFNIGLTHFEIKKLQFYHIDLHKIECGQDTRTTLIIRNIPQKCTSQMLFSAIRKNHKWTFDFLYMPIDTKTNGNLGYAFINMISPLKIIHFYKVFIEKTWNKFNSDKVASLAYARIQGEDELAMTFPNEFF